MPTLLDIVRGKRAESDPSRALERASGTTGQGTRTLAQTISAGTGKATGQGGHVSLLPEMSAQADVADSAAALRDESAIRGAQEASAAQSIATGEQIDRERSLFQADAIRAQAQRKANEIMADVDAGRRELDMQRDRATAEQLAFLARASNDRYLHDLQMAAQREGIYDEASFLEAYYEAELGAARDIFWNDQVFRKIQAMDDAAFAKYMSQISIDDAIAAYNADRAAMKAQAPYVMASAGITGAANIWAAKEEADWRKKREGNANEVSITNSQALPATAYPTAPTA